MDDVRKLKSRVQDLEDRLAAEIRRRKVLTANLGADNIQPGSLTLDLFTKEAQGILVAGNVNFYTALDMPVSYVPFGSGAAALDMPISGPVTPA